METDDTSPNPSDAGAAPAAQPLIEILHEDEDVVVASKPAGLLVHRSPESADRVFLLQELGYRLRRHLFPVHRLDRAASGAIAFACSSDAARRLQAHLAAADAVKEYLVLVRGETPERGEIDRPLTDHASGKVKPAFTSFERIACFSRCSLLRVRIKTGRHRQIRRHFAHLAHQVIGCTHHGKGNINRFFRERYGLPRLFLHSRLIDVLHPDGHSRLRAVAPLAGDLRQFLLRLEDVDRDLVAAL
jgi:tRNA pseudouridine65 synthase